MYLCVIFSLLKARTRNITDVFKTPGKLKGKTPRTARKRNVQEARIVRVSPYSPVYKLTPPAIERCVLFESPEYCESSSNETQ